MLQPEDYIHDPELLAELDLLMAEDHQTEQTEQTAAA